MIEKSTEQGTSQTIRVKKLTYWKLLSWRTSELKNFSHIKFKIRLLFLRRVVAQQYRKKNRMWLKNKKRPRYLPQGRSVVMNA